VKLSKSNKLRPTQADTLQITQTQQTMTGHNMTEWHAKAQPRTHNETHDKAPATPRTVRAIRSACGVMPCAETQCRTLANKHLGVHSNVKPLARQLASPASRNWASRSDAFRNLRNSRRGYLRQTSLPATPGGTAMPCPGMGVQLHLPRPTPEVTAPAAHLAITLRPELLCSGPLPG
jgi:hypothetical protein